MVVCSYRPQVAKSIANVDIELSEKDGIALETFSRPSKDMHMGGFPTISILAFARVL